MERLTIDEAIAHAREVAKQKYAEGMLCHANPNDDLLDGCVKCAEEHEQLAEWLEELKERRRMMKKYGHCTDNLETEIRAKAIDEFAEKLKAVYPIVSNDFGITMNAILNREIDEIAEQMKEGGSSAID